MVCSMVDIFYIEVPVYHPNWKLIDLNKYVGSYGNKEILRIHVM